MRKLITFLLTFIGVTLLMTTTASAYIDPATTAMLTQIIAGAFITLGVVFGVFRRKIILFFKNKSVNRTKRKIEKQVKKENREPRQSEKPETNEKDI
ncbi:MAG: hypothetical protein FWE83_00195 [Oscillospiraceae bacterium]|nr:hypothetical protein [Oscillospiraceae bacterium]